MAVWVLKANLPHPCHSFAAFFALWSIIEFIDFIISRTGLSLYLRFNLKAFEVKMYEPSRQHVGFAVRALALLQWLLLFIEVHHLINARFVENMLGVSFRAAESDERLVLLKLAHANTALLLLFEFQLFDLLCRFRANARAEGKLGSELWMLQNIRSGRLDMINVSALDGDLSSLK